jgi:glycosyltransferase involved in cell wall biosynthesis
MNIAILVKEFPPNVIGGTETQTMRMARELVRREGHEVTVYTKSYPEDESSETGQGLEPFDIVRVPNWQVSPFVSTLTFVLLATMYLIRDARKFDVLQCMMIYPNGFVGYVVHVITGLPYFAWIRGGDYYFMKDIPGKRWMIHHVLDDTTVLVQAERIRRDVQSEFDAPDLRVLGNGVSVPDETADGDAIVYVGRLKEQKGVDVLIEAVGELNERLLVVGDGPDRSRLASLAASVNADIQFVGEVPPEAVEEWLREGAVFVLPSVRGEGLPNAVLEAMAVGLPVVVTDMGGTADAVRDGQTGFVVEPGDQGELKEHLERVCGDPETRDRMGRNARQYVKQRYSWSAITDELTSLYEELA